MDVNSIFKIHGGGHCSDLNLFLHHLLLKDIRHPPVAFRRNAKIGAVSSLPFKGVFGIEEFSRQGKVAFRGEFSPGTYNWDIYAQGTIQILGIKLLNSPVEVPIGGDVVSTYVEVELGSFYFGEYIQKGSQ